MSVQSGLMNTSLHCSRENFTRASPSKSSSKPVRTGANAYTKDILNAFVRFAIMSMPSISETMILFSNRYSRRMCSTEAWSYCVTSSPSGTRWMVSASTLRRMYCVEPSEKYLVFPRFTDHSWIDLFFASRPYSSWWYVRRCICDLAASYRACILATSLDLSLPLSTFQRFSLASIYMSDLLYASRLPLV